ncbi:capsule assembly Wzi family protein [Treponema primitia]|uniref:capsule assembly Wzi family protein n=1 Tax=Treponema primitia TaxID=88058 RepID=UPI0002555618|nr:capsule assembly Wzi family protein [Treponema primitia]
MINNKKKCVFFASLFITIYSAYMPAQEILLSDNEKYYDFLALQGLTERSYLNYRTLSDSVWEINEDALHPWQGLNLGKQHEIFKNTYMRIYGPEIFTSYNTTNPYGQNDSTLWQGKGFNTSLSAGGRFELYGLELTLKPEFAFSQNQPFDLVPSAYSDGEAAKYGYYGLTSIDAPQRFGDDPYYEFSFGDSEIRYSWKTLTIGFGTQNIWLGPAIINPIILSNNAPPWPKLDIGLRKQPITIPKLNWYIGDIEARTWWGYLSESDFFDSNSSNDHNLITGLSLAYAPPSFLKGFTIGVNRIMLSKWDDFDTTGIFTLLVPFMQTSAGEDERDQRASLVLDYIFPTVGFEVYFEWARNDFGTNSRLIRNPYHTEAYTVGARKNFIFNAALQGELLLEITDIESSREYEFMGGGTTFYAHHIIKQGHTNRGQWLGSGLGTGGKSQYFGFTLFYEKGYSTLSIQRQNIDNDYVWFIKKNGDYLKAYLSGALSNYTNIYKNLWTYSSFIYSHIYSPTYDPDTDFISYNVHLSLGVTIKI